MEGCWSVLTILLADIGAGDIRTYIPSVVHYSADTVHGNTG